jgi:predicted peroxiredoxin
VPRDLVVKLTAGADAPERCMQGLTVAATAVAAGVDVSLWLTGEATWLAVPGRAEEIELPHAADPAELVGALLESARVTVCTQCAARRSLTAAALLDGVRIAGAQAFVAEVTAPDVQALIY